MTSLDKSRQLSLKKLTNNDVEAQVEINDLLYQFPRDLNVVDSRNHVITTSDKATAGPNQTVQFRLNTGTSYVHPQNSYLKLKVKTDVAGTSHFETGSVCNIIREVVILSSGGLELDRLTNQNLYHRDYIYNNFSQDYTKGAMQLAGFNVTTRTISSAGDTTFILPLWQLCGFFNRDKLIPSHLASGLVVQITFEHQTKAIRAGDGTTPTYTVSGMELVLDVYNLNNVVRRKLDAIAASNGLEYFYTSTHTSQYNTSSTQANLEISRAVSRALGAHAKIQVDADVATAVQDFTISESCNNISALQWRLGALYFPNKQLSDPVEMCQYTNYAFDKMRDYHNPADVSLAECVTNKFVAGVNLEKSTVVGLSGLPLNSSRRLHLSATFTSAKARTIYLFMQYMKVATCMLNSVKVSE